MLHHLFDFDSDYLSYSFLSKLELINVSEYEIIDISTKEYAMLTWKHEPNNTHIGTCGEISAKVYPWDGGFMWEVRVRCDCCGNVSLYRKGNAQKVEHSIRCVTDLVKQMVKESASS